MSEDFLDFGEIEVKPKYNERYKGLAGEKHRISIIYPKPNEAGKQAGPFVMRSTHYSDKYFYCKEGICCEKLGPSKNRLACLVVQYKTKKDGTLIKREGEAIPFDYNVKEWVFTDTKFNQLKALHNEWDLKSHDLLVTLKGTEQFQDLEFVPCKESIWQLKPEFKDTIYKESEPLRSRLVNALGHDLSTDEIKELLGLEVAQAGEVISGEEDLNDILAEVQYCLMGAEELVPPFSKEGLL